MKKETSVEAVAEEKNKKLEAIIRLLVEKLNQTGIETEGKVITIKNNQVTVK